jgi:hypothetical protein
MLKLTLEVTADNQEELLKALNKIKYEVDLGVIFISTKNFDGHNYYGEIKEIR